MQSFSQKLQATSGQIEGHLSPIFADSAAPLMEWVDRSRPAHGTSPSIPNMDRTLAAHFVREVLNQEVEGSNRRSPFDFLHFF